jgi:putative transcriptional regulator
MKKDGKIKHHLSQDLLMKYSSGILCEAFSLAVATHISMCDDCRAALESFEAVGGALLDISTPEEMSVDSFESVMALIESEPAEITQPASQPTDVPSALSDYIGGSLHDVKWRPIGLGVKQSLLKTSGNSTARLLYIPAGTAVPHHSHNGNELTLVLKGAFEDEISRFGPGDVEMADEDLDHQPVAVEGEDCICLAVTDAPLKFQTLVHKLVQPFLKI